MTHDNQSDGKCGAGIILSADSQSPAEFLLAPLSHLSISFCEAHFLKRTEVTHVESETSKFGVLYGFTGASAALPAKSFHMGHHHVPHECCNGLLTCELQSL